MKFLLLSLFVSYNAYSSDFDGCGEYEFKGILKIDKQAKSQMNFIVHDGTKSQMTFEFEKEDDIVKLSPFLNSQSYFKATIPKAMDGTKGVLRNLSGISKVFPDPLKNTDSGIKKIKSQKCD